MYRKVQDFLDHWKEESDATIKIINNLTDESLKQKIDPEGRSLGFLTWHIIETMGEMMSKTGLNIEHIKEEDFDITKADVLKEQYKISSDKLLKEIKENWNDDTLETEDDMYGSKWKRSFTLKALIEHQLHHTGQMTVLMRQAGLRVPGVYGPAREDWADMGMKAPK